MNIQIVNNVGRDMGETTRETEHQEIVKMMKELLQTRDAPGKTEQGGQEQNQK